MANPLLLQILQQPEAITGLRLADWDLLLRQARRSNLLAKLYALLDEKSLLEHIPSQPRAHLEWMHVLSNRHEQAVRWEVEQIQKALLKAKEPVILLKGAAYTMAGLPPARGRLFSDIDILVPKNSLDAVEAALTLHGWVTTHHDEYDQRYYRTWMHELPPMQHVKRMTVIDVHHGILPETTVNPPDPAKLFTGARLIEGATNLKVLAPVDMVLHSLAHLFHEGEWGNGLRDLNDIQQLLEYFGRDAEFWPRLAFRAKELNLTRSLFYTLRYVSQIFRMAIPKEIVESVKSSGPNALLLMLMDRLFIGVLIPKHSDSAAWKLWIAGRLLYIRATWLRMPSALLVRHLFHKAFISPKK